MKAPYLWFELTLGALITLTCICGFTAYYFFGRHWTSWPPSKARAWELMDFSFRSAGACLGIVWAVLTGYVIIKGELRIRRRMVERSRSFWLRLLIFLIYLIPSFYFWAQVFATPNGPLYPSILFILLFVGTLFASPLIFLMIWPVYMILYFAAAYGTLFLCYRMYDRWKKKGVIIESKHQALEP